MTKRIPAQPTALIKVRLTSSSTGPCLIGRFMASTSVNLALCNPHN
jgi:hypothetical protein